MASHCLSQQGSSSYFAIMTEPASDFKNECYHYSLQYSTEASLESNKEQNVYFKDPHFPLNAWIKLQTVVFWELSYILKQRFWRSASFLEIGLWLACEFSNTGSWFFCNCSCCWIFAFWHGDSFCHLREWWIVVWVAPSTYVFPLQYEQQSISFRHRKASLQHNKSKECFLFLLLILATKL